MYTPMQAYLSFQSVGLTSCYKALHELWKETMKGLEQIGLKKKLGKKIAKKVIKKIAKVNEKFFF